MQLVRCQAFASACAFIDTVWLAYHSLAPLPLHDFLNRQHGPQLHPFFLLLSIHATIVLVASYLLCIIDTAGSLLNAILIDIVLFAPRLIRDCPCRQHPHHHPYRHCTYCIVLYNLPLSVPLRAALTMSQSSSIFRPRLIYYRTCCRHPCRHPHCTHCVLLVIVLAARILIGIHFIDVVLIASCLIQQTAFGSVTQSDAIYGDAGCLHWAS